MRISTTFLLRLKWLMLLLLSLGVAVHASALPNDTGVPSLGQALNPDGTLRAGMAGSFNAQGYSFGTAPDGRPTFHPAAARRTQGTGDEHWQDGFGLCGANGEVSAVACAPNGDIYIGGYFTAVGKVPASLVAKWNGTAWSALGTGIDVSVYSFVGALAIDRNGNVYAGGGFYSAGGVPANNIAKWNGTAWSALGAGVTTYVNALVADGAGNVYAGGSFYTAGGSIPANGVAKWNGTAWSALGTGVSSIVYTLALDGNGNLYAGGSFTSAGGVVVNCVAKWNGTTWSALGTGVSNPVFALAIDGNGNVYAGGDFITAGGVTVNRVAKWNGTAWSALGTGATPLTVHNLAIDGNGNVYAGGAFVVAGGVSASSVAKWDGTAWSALGTGMNASMRGMAIDANNNVYVGGGFGFIEAGGVGVRSIAKWNGTAWSALGAGLNDVVNAVAMDGSGNVYIGGDFIAAGGVAASHVAKWNGTTWSALGLGVGQGMNLGSTVYALAVDGSGNVYAGGDFLTAGTVAANRVAKWNGAAWSALGTGLAGVNSLAKVYALAVDGSGNVYAGGSFSTAGGVAANRVAKWNGTAWSALGMGTNTNTGLNTNFSTVFALAIDRNNNVYVGGEFTLAGGATANNVAKWNGTAWSALGIGVDNRVYALAADGSGNVYAGGNFATAGGTPARYIAKWNGTAWSALGTGASSFVSALAADGSGHVYVGGDFYDVGGFSVRYIAQWDGTAWNTLGTGLNRSVSALAVDGSGGVYAGGSFLTVGDVSKVTAFFGHYNPSFISTTNPAAALAAQVNVFPNPAHAVVTVQLPAALTHRPISATLVDGLGRMVRHYTLPASAIPHPLNVVGLPTGIYFLRLDTETGTVSKKLVIE